MAIYLGPYDHEEPPVAPTEEWAARRDLGTALRRINELAVTSSADINTLEAMTALINEQADRLAETPQRLGKLAHMDPDQDHFQEGSIVSHEISSITGLCNPITAPLHLWIADDEVHGKVTMGWQFEGPPGFVHGGFVAALFDDFLGMGQKLTDQPGFTGTLSVRYIKPTPLAQELRLFGKVHRVEGRKNILRGEMYAGDTLTASCEGLFIRMPKDYLQKVQAEAESHDRNVAKPTGVNGDGSTYSA